MAFLHGSFDSASVSTVLITQSTTSQESCFTPLTLSRSPLAAGADSTDLEQLAELAAMAAVAQLPASTERLHLYQQAQREDATCSLLKEYCLTGWPERNRIPSTAKPYWEKRGELTV